VPAVNFPSCEAYTAVTGGWGFDLHAAANVAKEMYDSRVAHGEELGKAARSSWSCRVAIDQRARIESIIVLGFVANSQKCGNQSTGRAQLESSPVLSRT
jgi:hypothetical protein